MKNVSILFPDSVHFHERNFKSLFDLIERHKIQHTFLKDRNKWVSAYGNYEQFSDELSCYFDKLKKLSLDELYTYKIKGISLFSVARDEVLTYFLVKDGFTSQIKHKPNDIELINIMSIIDMRALVLNLAAAYSWIEYWKDKLDSTRNHTYACIFSGGQIYNRSLLECLKTHPTTPLVMEHFFTGNEYYIEEKYQPIPNNCNLKYDSVYNSVELNADLNEFDRARAKAVNKVLLAKNKNVTQPHGEFIIESNNRKVITIIGQVANDFSVICTATKYLSSVNFYKELIEKLLDNTEAFIVFKAHPWERHKNNIKSPYTLEKLSEFKSKVSEEKSERLFLTEDFNLECLIKQSDHIVTLCSQSAIEAAFHGMKPIQLGNAFYGNKGFTYDFSEIDDFIKFYNNGSMVSFLSIDEFKKLEIFLIKFLESELVSVHKSGILSLENKLKIKPLISLVKDNQMKGNNVRIVVAAPPKKISAKKIEKFKRDPKAFLIDSQYSLLNFIGRVVYRDK